MPCYTLSPSLNNLLKKHLRWALLFTEAPKELPDRNIHLIVIEMASMTVKHILKVTTASIDNKVGNNGGNAYYIEKYPQGKKN